MRSEWSWNQRVSSRHSALHLRYVLCAPKEFEFVFLLVWAAAWVNVSRMSFSYVR